MGGVAWTEFDGVLFDLDGVITPTAEMHRRAWARLFAAEGFTDQDYLDHIDGKPRDDGIRAFLAARGRSLPDGSPEDEPGTATIAALGNDKNRTFNDLLTSEGIEAYPGTLRVMELLADHSIPTAVVSSSRNARAVLAAARLSDRFGVIVDGLTADQLGLPGKPDPAMFQHAARELAVEPGRSIVVEDAVSGVAAAAAGGFGLVIGVDRTGNAEALHRHGADLVVSDLAETLADPPEGTER